MKIFMMLPANASGGTLSVVETLATGLRERGVIVHWVVIGTSSITIDGIDFSVGRGQRIRFLVSYAKNRGVDLIHAHLSTYLVAAAVAFFAGIPSIRTLHGKISRPGMRTLRERVFMRLALSLRQKLVLVSDGVSSEVASHYPSLRSGRDFFEIPNGINPVRTREPAFSDIPHFFFSGRFEEAKGFANLIAAFQRLYAEGVNARLVLAGDGPLRGIVPSAFLESQFVSMSDGWRSSEEVQTLASNCGYFVLPSLSEGLSIALLEAMATGLVPIVSRAAVSNGVVIDGVNGYIVENDSMESLYAGIKRCCGQDRAQFEAMSRAAARHVEENFSANSMVNMYRSLYDDLRGKSVDWMAYREQE